MLGMSPKKGKKTFAVCQFIFILIFVAWNVLTIQNKNVITSFFKSINYMFMECCVAI